MGIVLPLGALALLIHAARFSTGDARSAVLRGAVIWGVVVAVGTELVGAADAIGVASFAVLWVGTIVACGVYLARRNSRAVPERTTSGSASLHAADAAYPQLIGAGGVLAGIVVILLVTLFTAFVAAPSHSDAMAYHLPRVMQWIQNGSLEPYPTHSTRQIWVVPGGDYLQLQFQLLSGGDRFANLTQWLAFAGNIMLAALLAAQIGAGREGQLLAALFTATAPNAIAQASGAQVEHVTAFWTGAAISFALSLRDAAHRNEPLRTLSLFAGAAGGLALLTKSTTVLFLTPFVLWVLIAFRPRSSVHRACVWAVMAACILSMNAPHAMRTFSVFGSIRGPQVAQVANEKITPATVISNVSRNLAMHYWMPWEPVNVVTRGVVAGLHQAIGADVSDPRTTVGPYRSGRLSFAEHDAGNPVHMAMLLVVPIILLARREARSAGFLFSICAFAGFVLFSAYLKWQPWHPRLLLPSVLLAAPAFGFLFERVGRGWMPRAFVLVLLSGAGAAMLMNPMRRLVPPQLVTEISRERQLLAADPSLYPSYRGAADYIHAGGCRRIGLLTASHAYEYPLWVMLRHPDGSYPEISHSGVFNETSRLSQPRPFTPCAIVRLEKPYVPQYFVMPRGYSPVWKHGAVSVYASARSVSGSL